MSYESFPGSEGSDEESSMVVSDIDDFLDNAKVAIQQSLSKEYESESLQYSAFSRPSTVANVTSIEPGKADLGAATLLGKGDDSFSSSTESDDSDDDSLFDSVFSESTSSGYSKNKNILSKFRKGYELRKSGAKGFLVPRPAENCSTKPVDLQKYRIDYDDNSILSSSSLRPSKDREIKKAWELVERTANELVSLSEKENQTAKDFDSNKHGQTPSTREPSRDHTNSRPNPPAFKKNVIEGKDQSADTNPKAAPTQKSAKTVLRKTGGQTTVSQMESPSMVEEDDGHDAFCDYDEKLKQKSVVLDKNKRVKGNDDGHDASCTCKEKSKQNRVVIDQNKAVQRNLRKGKEIFCKRAERSKEESKIEQNTAPMSLTIDSLALHNCKQPSHPARHKGTGSVVSTSLSDSVLSSCETSRRLVTDVRRRRMARLQSSQTLHSTLSCQEESNLDYIPSAERRAPEGHEQELERCLTRPATSLNSARLSTTLGGRKNPVAPLAKQMISERLKSLSDFATRKIDSERMETLSSTRKSVTAAVVPTYCPSLDKHHQNVDSPIGLDSKTILKTIAPSPDSSEKDKPVSSVPRSQLLARNTHESSWRKSDPPTFFGRADNKVLHSRHSPNDESFDVLVLRQAITPSPLSTQGSLPPPKQHNDSFEDIVLRQRPNEGKFQNKSASTSPSSVAGFMPSTHNSCKFRSKKLRPVLNQANARFIDNDDDSSTESTRIIDLEVH
eukprot:scaffold25436_cov127-Cylindrotheca_fusiformis.AAC.3